MHYDVSISVDFEVPRKPNTDMFTKSLDWQIDNVYVYDKVKQYRTTNHESD